MSRDRPAKALRGSTHAAGQAPEQVQEDGDPSPTPVGPARRVGAPLRPGTQAGRWHRARGGGQLDTYPSRSCRPRGAGTRACTRRGKSLVCSRICADSHRCALGTHPRLHRDTGRGSAAPGTPVQAPSQWNPAQVPALRAHACRSRVGRRQGPSLTPGQPAWGEEPPPRGGQNVGSPGGQTQHREPWSGQGGGCRGPWAGGGDSRLLGPFETEPGARPLPRRSGPEILSGQGQLLLWDP